ncbi:NfeD family protein [Psychromonas sp.]|uniref:NfeD family protein n=1 Tax=Psychromonas sp. TaxID=1884585 RepID=UPI00356A1FCB
METIFPYLPQSFIVVGLILLVIEVLILGFSTFYLFFIGAGLIASGLLMAIGVIPETLFNALLSTAIITSLIALVAWKPMKNIQNKVEPKHVNNDMIGYQFILTEELAIGRTITHRYSGIDWKVKAKEPLSAGTEVKIIAIEVGVLTVQRVE